MLVFAPKSRTHSAAAATVALISILWYFRNPQVAELQLDIIHNDKMSAPLIVKATAKHTATVIFVHVREPKLINLAEGMTSSQIRVWATRDMVGNQSRTCSSGMRDFNTLNGSYLTRTMSPPAFPFVCNLTSIADPLIPLQLTWVCLCQPGELCRLYTRVFLPHDTIVPKRFDIYSFGFDCDEDEKGMLKTRSALEDIIKTEVGEGTPQERIVLGGFSQGGAMTLLTGLTTPGKLGGLAILSGWLPLRDRFKKVRFGAPPSTIFVLTNF